MILPILTIPIYFLIARITKSDQIGWITILFVIINVVNMRLYGFSIPFFRTLLASVLVAATYFFAQRPFPFRGIWFISKTIYIQGAIFSAILSLAASLKLLSTSFTCESFERIFTFRFCGCTFPTTINLIGGFEKFFVATRALANCLHALIMSESITSLTTIGIIVRPNQFSTTTCTNYGRFDLQPFRSNLFPVPFRSLCIGQWNLAEFMDMPAYISCRETRCIDGGNKFSTTATAQNLRGFRPLFTLAGFILSFCDLLRSQRHKVIISPFVVT